MGRLVAGYNDKKYIGEIEDVNHSEESLKINFIKFKKSFMYKGKLFTRPEKPDIATIPMTSAYGKPNTHKTRRANF